MIDVVLAERQTLLKEGIRKILAYEKDIFIVGEAASAAEVHDLYTKHNPKLLVWNIGLEDPTSLEILGLLQIRALNMQVLVLSASFDVIFLQQLLLSGIKGYVLYDEVPEAFIRAIKAVAQGDIWISYPVLKRLLNSRGFSIASDYSMHPLSQLSAREQQVLRLLIQGLRNEEIAQKIYLSERTVRHYVEQILEKLGVDNRTKAVVIATQLGFI